MNRFIGQSPAVRRIQFKSTSVFTQALPILDSHDLEEPTFIETDGLKSRSSRSPHEISFRNLVGSKAGAAELHNRRLLGPSR
jgi:hypothetical protein